MLTFENGCKADIDSGHSMGVPPLTFPTDFSKNRLPVCKPNEVDPYVVMRHVSGLLCRKQKTTAPRYAHREGTFPDTCSAVLIRRYQGIEVEPSLVARIQDL